MRSCLRVSDLLLLALCLVRDYIDDHVWRLRDIGRDGGERD